ncbi:hypothetical protein AB6A40_001525 [Gnathostoma spinigerum]|uniref:Uncharacterized protein n=1 Tax=Gnathostoma spinigerum TaxID=75299 RepID=A0ABD6EBN9_9BILA
MNTNMMDPSFNGSGDVRSVRTPSAMSLLNNCHEYELSPIELVHLMESRNRRIVSYYNQSRGDRRLVTLQNDNDCVRGQQGGRRITYERSSSGDGSSADQQSNGLSLCPSHQRGYFNGTEFNRDVRLSSVDAADSIAYRTPPDHGVPLPYLSVKQQRRLAASKHRRMIRAVSFDQHLASNGCAEIRRFHSRHGPRGDH